ncbi:hypothetical protein ADL04_27745 [Streptomyces sp. NRRL B-3648]|nr:hypothetical protein ADL04_27745 [Streptomyces sp. NRRL B-3648]
MIECSRGGHDGECPPCRLGAARLFRVSVVGVEYDGVRARQAQRLEIVEDLFDGADAGGPVGGVDRCAGDAQGDAGREPR